MLLYIDSFNYRSYFFNESLPPTFKNCPYKEVSKTITKQKTFKKGF